VALVFRTANPAPLATRPDTNCGRQRKPVPRSCAFDEWNIICCLRHVPQSRKLARVQQARFRKWRQYPQIWRRATHWTWNEAVARGECEWAVRGGEAVETSLDRYWRGVAWRYDCKTQFSAAGFAPEFLLDQLRIVELAPSKVQISSQS